MEMKKIILSSLFFFCQQAVANEVEVVDVNIKYNPSGHARVDVTLLHGDTGWDHYANAWEILDSNKKPIATRVLHHPHVGEQPFTRSLYDVSLPVGAKFVYVRGRDKVHGYGKMIKVEIEEIAVFGDRI